MSLNLRIRRRSFPSTSQMAQTNLLWLAALALLLASLVAWQRNWQPEKALAALGQEGLLLPFNSFIIPIDSLNRLHVEPDSVVMVSSTVIENPRIVMPLHSRSSYLSPEKTPFPGLMLTNRAKVEFYTVQSGDTLWTIAERFGLDLDTLRWSNPELERNPDVLSVGSQSYEYCQYRVFITLWLKMTA